MRIVVIGTGYVGLVSGICFSDFGHDVVCVDKDPAKIEQLNAGHVPIFEPGLEVLMTKNAAAGRLSFTLDLANAMKELGLKGNYVPIPNVVDTSIFVPAEKPSTSFTFLHVSNMVDEHKNISTILKT